MDDRERLARLRGPEEGAREAFDEIFRDWYVRVVRAADAVVRDRAVAEELAQDVMLELWRRRERLADDGSPQAYLLQAVRNRALNHVRHQRVAEREATRVVGDPPHGAAAPGAAAEVEGAELDAALQDAIASLPPRCREVFELSRGRGLRYAEIAETLGVSVKAVEAQMGRALRTMRERLAPWLPGGDRL